MPHGLVAPSSLRTNPALSPRRAAGNANLEDAVICKSKRHAEGGLDQEENRKPSAVTRARPAASCPLGEPRGTASLGRRPCCGSRAPGGTRSQCLQGGVSGFTVSTLTFRETLLGKPRSSAEMCRGTIGSQPQPGRTPQGPPRCACPSEHGKEGDRSRPRFFCQQESWSRGDADLTVKAEPWMHEAGERRTFR